MVRLAISTLSGQSGVRFFPFQGHLGLTPVRVEGVVRTCLDEDKRPLAASHLAVAVRCYESRRGRSGAYHTNLLLDYSHVLWAKPDAEQWADVGDMSFPFRITLPKRVAGLSATNLVEYRIFWRVEAILDHIPMPAVGHRLLKYFDLNLVRYDVPRYDVPRYDVPRHPALPPPPPLPAYRHTSKPRSPVVRYSITPPAPPLGPGDLVPVSLVLIPVHSAVSIRSASLLVERRIHLPPFSRQPVPASPSYPASSTSILSIDSASTTTPVPPVPAAPADAPAKPLTAIIAAADGVPFARDAYGVWAKTVTLHWPESRGPNKWSIGETIQTTLVSVRFFLRTKIVVSSPAGTETLELEERELLVVATNEAQRRLALAKFREQRDDAIRHKSTSPGTRVHTLSESEPEQRPPRAADKPVPPPPPALAPGSAPVAPKSSKPPRRAPRRPHTSAGPRDKSSRPYASEALARGSDSDGAGAGAPEGGVDVRIVSSRWRPEPGDDGDAMAQEQVRAWEEELARIEQASRRSTRDMLRAWGMKRMRIGRAG